MKQMKYYVDAQGAYLGGWDSSPPVGAIEVPDAPEDARQVWGGAQWGEAQPSVPQSVTMRQARLAMLQAGILDDVEALIASMPGDDGRAARIDWEYALEVRRDWPLIAALAQQMSLTSEQVDELFIAAASIPQ